MTQNPSARSAPARPAARHRARVLALGVLLLGAVALAVLVLKLTTAPAPSIADPAGPAAGAEAPSPDAGNDGAVTDADGLLPGGATVFETGYPGVANLDPALRDALGAATSDAADSGLTVVVNSGWRSPDLQDSLLRDAISTYGSAEEAARWVATAETSVHVSGDAVDVGPSDAATWLSQYGSRYGLCQIYGNEPWHLELRADAGAAGCPRMYRDPTEDPRLQG